MGFLASTQISLGNLLSCLVQDRGGSVVLWKALALEIVLSLNLSLPVRSCVAVSSSASPSLIIYNMTIIYSLCTVVVGIKLRYYVKKPGTK